MRTTPPNNVLLLGTPKMDVEDILKLLRALPYEAKLTEFSVEEVGDSKVLVVALNYDPPAASSQDSY
jgi:hypothetical protein